MEKEIIVFKLMYRPSVPIDVGTITPSIIAKTTAKDVKSITIWIGGKKSKAEEVFDIDSYNVIANDPSKISIHFTGVGTEKLWYIGRGIECGEIIVYGDTGPLLGYEMRGGQIIVQGDAREWLGASMYGGMIMVKGSIGDLAGAKPFSKSSNGMSGGKIIVYGDAGSFIGLGMHRGYIEIRGNAKDFIGLRMMGGTIVVHGYTGIYPGLEMIDGLIVIGKGVESIALGFHELDLGIDRDKKTSVLKLFLGDSLSNGRGVVIVLRT